MTISYVLGKNIYLNITNRCTNACDFCLRHGKKKDVDTWQSDRDLTGSDELCLEREPTVTEVIEDLKKYDLSLYKEVVFCGFGEPFMRFDDCVKIAGWLKEQNMAVRVNTNGQANLINGRNVTDEMVGLFDVVSISLNAENAEKYEEICHSDYPDKAYESILEFAKLCSQKGIKVFMSVVDIIGEEAIEKCKKIADDCGATLRVREYIE